MPWNYNFNRNKIWKHNHQPQDCEVQHFWTHPDQSCKLLFWNSHESWIRNSPVLSIILFPQPTCSWSPNYGQWTSEATQLHMGHKYYYHYYNYYFYIYTLYMHTHTYIYIYMCWLLTFINHFLTDPIWKNSFQIGNGTWAARQSWLRCDGRLLACFGPWEGGRSHAAQSLRPGQWVW